MEALVASASAFGEVATTAPTNPKIRNGAINIAVHPSGIRKV
jgi:hypothetical protein